MRKPVKTIIRAGFTMMELQVAIILLSFGVVTLSSLLATQSRLLKRLEGDFKPGATVYVTPSNDPWVRKISAPARITPAEITQTAPPTVSAGNTVDIVDQQTDLNAGTLTVTADLTPIP